MPLWYREFVWRWGMFYGLLALALRWSDHLSTDLLGLTLLDLDSRMTDGNTQPIAALWIRA